MFEPGAPIDEVERDVESIIMALVHELGERADADPEPLGAEERAYIAAFSDARANMDRNQAGLLSTAIRQPNLAESLIYLNQRLDRQDLDPREPVGILGIIVRLAMDGLWVSDILDSTRFKPGDRRRITDVLTGMTYLTDARLKELLAELQPKAPGDKKD